ncbi:MAG: hypothetical protein JWP48_2661 [Actinoallomurus sp.]|nr:hypothetical protein [Actinoallomurus sp.]
MNPTTVSAQPDTPFIDVVREFEATPAQVFRASTDPELVSRWLGPRELEMRLTEYDARTGGSYGSESTDAAEHLTYRVVNDA